MTVRVLAVLEAYLPGSLGGGPIRSVANLVDRLGDGFEWHIITRDRDFHQRVPYEGVAFDRWTQVGNARVFYASPAMASPPRLLALVRATPHDVVYLNSFFSPRYSVLLVLARRLGLIPRRGVLVAPRGEFSGGAFGLKSWKKKPFVWLARRFGAYRDVDWHVSTEHEAADIGRVMGVPTASIHVARNLAAAALAADVPPSPRAGDRRLRIVFLSRIARMKNLDFALRVLARLREPAVFTIHGPLEDAGYWQECERLIAELPAGVSVEYRGVVAARDVIAELSRHDLLLLPSRGENFGHVLVEAWQAGLPVLTSDRTPWRELEQAGVGWALDLERPQAFVDAIAQVAALAPAERDALRARCAAFGRRFAHDEAATASNRAMFEHAARTPRAAT